MKRFYWPALLGLGALLLFSGLSRRDLWQDEAETALLARSIVKNGRPLAFDGLNVVSGETSHEFGPDHLWRWSPWLQFYVCAASFAVFGESAAAARLPFALIGLFCLPLAWWWTRRLFGDEQRARLAAALLALNVPFLLHARQARWYAPACAAACGALGFALGALRRESRRDAAGFAACAVVLFYANFFVAAAFFGALICAAPLLAPSRRGLALVAAGLAAAALACLPGVWLHAGMGAVELSRFSAHVAVRQFFGYAAWFMIWLCPAPLLAALACDANRERPALFLSAFCAAFLALLALGPWRFFRYMTPLIPAGCALSAAALAWIWKRSRQGAAAAAALLVLTDAFSAPLSLALPHKLMPFDRHVVVAGVGSPLLGFLTELATDFPSCDRAAAAYLNAHASAGDVVIATYGDMPLQFYTKGLKILGGGQGLKLTTEPDWIVAQPSVLSFEPGKDADVFRFLNKRIDVRRYEEVALSCQSGMLATCPEPWAHEFTISAKPPLRLLRRLKPPPFRNL